MDLYQFFNRTNVHCVSYFRSFMEICLPFSAPAGRISLHVSEMLRPRKFENKLQTCGVCSISSSSHPLWPFSREFCKCQQTNVDNLGSTDPQQFSPACNFAKVIVKSICIPWLFCPLGGKKLCACVCMCVCGAGGERWLLLNTKNGSFGSS